MPKMTKAHFQLIAETIANLPSREWAHETTDCVSFAELVRELADMCASTNPAFSRARFVDACTTENYRAPRNVTRYDTRPLDA
jgi:hypothetical protein